MQVVLRRLRPQECLELALQTRVVEDAGVRDRRGVQPLALEARNLQNARRLLLVGRTGAWTCTRLPSMAMMKSRLPKRTRAPGTQPSVQLAIRNLAASDAQSPYLARQLSVFRITGK